ncbi:hypothetical protein [Psychroserpens sp. MEBiC05023]
MKKITTIILVCVATLFTYGQQTLELKVKKSSDAPNTASEHLYLIEVINSSGKDQKFTIVSENKACENIQQSKQVLLKNQVLNAQNNGTFNSGIVEGKSSKDFYIKVSRNSDTALGTWNCIEIRAISSNAKTISNTLTIKSQIPDPKNFN